MIIIAKFLLLAGCTDWHLSPARCPPRCLCRAASCCYCHTAACLSRSGSTTDQLLIWFWRAIRDMKRAKWSAAPVEPGAGTLAGAGPAIRRGTALSLTTNGYSGVTHRPLFESYQICHRKPSHSSSRVTPARVTFSLKQNKVYIKYSPANSATYKWTKSINTFKTFYPF